VDEKNAPFRRHNHGERKEERKLHPWSFCSPNKAGILRVPVSITIQAAILAQRRYYTNDHPAKECKWDYNTSQGVNKPNQI